MTLALVLLLAALTVFFVSTRQTRQPERFLIWLIGAGLIGWSASQVAAAPGHYGLLRAWLDAWSGSTLVNVFSRNATTVTQFLAQLLDVFVLLGASLGVIALIACIKDETIERITRPAMFLLIGASCGALAALAIVAIGLGGQIRPRAYLGYVSADDVFDGDTFRMGEVSLRLLGVDAPELHQECRGIDECGVRARAQLVVLVDGALVQCEPRESRSGRFTESFGRPLVKCWVRRHGRNPIDLGERMIQNGYAIQYEGDESFGYSEAEATGAQRGVMGGCMLRPDLWRNDNEARRAFESGATLPPDSLRGQACAPPPPPELEGADRHGPVSGPITEAPSDEPTGPTQ